MTLILAAKFVAYGTCLFLIPFCLQAYLTPLASLNVRSIGLLPAEDDRLTGLSNIRGSIGGLRLAIIAMMGLGAYSMNPQLCLGAAITLGGVSGGRLLSLVLEGWNTPSFVTGTAEVVMVLSMLHLGAFI